jgi:hypothetical protein
MEFSQKLDFLMNITKTTNSKLSLQLSLDASYISRLRTGTRLPAKDAGYLRAMSAYFARRCIDMNLADTVAASARKGFGAAADSTEDMILNWLSETEAEMAKPVGDFLTRLSSMSIRKPPAYVNDSPADIRMNNKIEAEVFYGIQGKQEAVVEFLNTVIRQDTPRTLLLFSEENFDWLTENREFAAKWAQLLVQAVMKGNRIKIIHSISRHLDEMLAGITEWLPIYMSGMVEPFYYPKTRDGVFQRTLFVAPEIAAVLATSVTGRIGETANYLIRDKKAVEAAAVEFHDYLALCRPLLRVFDSRKAAEFSLAFSDFESKEAETFLKSDSMSLLTMPPDIYRQLCSAGNADEAIRSCAAHRQRVKKFEVMLGRAHFHEIIKLPDIQSVREGSAPPLGFVFSGPGSLHHTPESLRLQLSNMIQLLGRYKYYHVYIDDNVAKENHSIYLKENVGVFVQKAAHPQAAFVINEGKMTAAFSDYFTSMLGKAYCSPENKRRTIDKLQSVVASL